MISVRGVTRAAVVALLGFAALLVLISTSRSYAIENSWTLPLPVVQHSFPGGPEGFWPNQSSIAVDSGFHWQIAFQSSTSVPLVDDIYVENTTINLIREGALSVEVLAQGTAVYDAKGMTAYGVGFRSPSLAIDKQGTAHLAYLRSDFDSGSVPSSYNTIMYSQKPVDSDTWTPAMPVVHYEGSRGSTAIAVDPSGHWQIAYVEDRRCFGSPLSIKFVQEGSTSVQRLAWTLANSGAMLSAPSLAIDARGNSHLVYQLTGPFTGIPEPPWPYATIMYTEKSANEATWTVATPLAQRNAWCLYAPSASIATDSAGRWQIAYNDNVGSYADPNPINYLRIIQEDSPVTQVIASFSESQISSPSMVIDAQGTSHVIYDQANWPMGGATIMYQEKISPKMVVVTHGWMPAWKPGSGNTEKFTSMESQISSRLSEKQQQGAWGVEFYDWSKQATTGDPFTAARHALTEGEKLGKAIIDAGLESVHLVGHSAGAWLIQAAADYIKAHNPNVEVRLTFLDAFATDLIPALSPSRLGLNTAWAEQYVDHRPRQGIPGSPTDAPWTDWALPHALNVDVTHWNTTGEDGHGWPVSWYKMTTQMPDAYSWGFGQSLEYSGIPPEDRGYQRGQIWPAGDAGHFGGSELYRLGAPISLMSIVASYTGTVVAEATRLHLTTGSPVWAEVPVTLTEPADFILFGYEFLTDAEAKLSVYWQGDLVYEVLRSEVDSGLIQDIIWTGTEWAPGDYVLKFELEPLTDAAASLEVSGVQFGATPEPATLSLLAVGGLVALCRRR